MVFAGTNGVLSDDSDLSFSGSTLSATNLTSSGTVSFGTLTDSGESIAITKFVDEGDAIASNDNDTTIPTSAAIKDYVDTQDAAIASDTLTFTNKTFDVEASGNSISNIDVADLKSGVLDTDISSVSSSDDTIASAKAIKTYIDSQVTAQDLDFQGDSGGALSIDLDSETMTFAGGTGVVTVGSGNTVTFNSVDSEIVHDNLSGFVANEHIDHSGVTLTAGNGLSGGGDITASRSFALDLNELSTETSIADADFIAMVDADNDGSRKITFENLEDAIFASVSGDIVITEAGVATIQANSVALATDTTGDFVNSITAGTGLTSTGATSGENISHSLSVDASQTQITAVGALDAGSITSNFGNIDNGSSTANFGATTVDSLSVSDGNITNVGDIALDSISADGSTINVAIGDSTSDVFTIKEGSNKYFAIATSESAENIAIGTGVSGTAISIGHSTSVTTVNDNLIVTGDLTVNGATSTISTTNTVVSDTLIELGNGTSGTPANDSGIVIERGSADNAFLGFDESDDKFIVGTGSFTGASTGSLTITTGTLKANIEGNLTGNVTGTLQTAAQGNITSVGTLTALQVDNININGNTIISSDTNGDINLTPNGSGNVVISSVDINGGAIDATNITIGSGKTLDVSGGTLTLANDQISGNAINGGTIGSTTISALAGALSMGGNNITAVGSVALDSIESASTGNGFDLTLLNDKTDALEIKEGSNAYMTFITTTGSEEIQIDKALDINAVSDFGSNAMTNVNIDSGAIDGTNIGANSAGTGAFTTLTASGDVNFDSNTLFVDASENKVAIGSNSPAWNFQVGDQTTIFGSSLGSDGVLIAPNANNVRLIIEGQADASITLVDDGATSDLKAMMLQTEGGFTKFRSLNDDSGGHSDNIIVMNHDNGNVGIGGSPIGSTAHLSLVDSVSPQLIFNDTGGTTNKRVFRISGGGDAIFFEGRNNDDSGAGAVGGDGGIMSLSLDDGQATFFHEVQVKNSSGGDLRLVRDDTTTTSGETLGRLLFSSTDGGVDTADASAVIEAIATEDFGTGNKGAKLIFSTKPDGDDVDHNDHTRMTIFQDGDVLIGEGTNRSGFTPSLTVMGSQPSMGLRGQDGNSGIFFNTIMNTSGSGEIKNFYSSTIHWATASNDGGTSESTKMSLDTSGNLTLSGSVSSGNITADTGGTSIITADGNNSSGDDGRLILKGHTSAFSRAYVNFNNGVTSGGKSWFLGQIRGSNSFVLSDQDDFTAGGNAFVVDSNRRVGIGTSSPSASRLHVQSPDGSNSTESLVTLQNLETTNGQCNGLFVNAGQGSSDDSFRVQTRPGVEALRVKGDGAVSTAQTISQGSDIKLKENIKDLEKPLEKVNQLRGVSYNRIDLENKFQYGLIAQEVEKVIPELVTEEDGTKMLYYTSIIPFLVESIKELSQKVEELEKTCKDCC